MAKGTELIEPVNTALTEYVDFGDDVGRGLEGVTRNELLTPFLTVLHYQCPQIAEGDEKFVDGARPGMLYNTATRQLSSGRDGVEIVPVMREAIYTEWMPREEGGGFRGIRQTTDPEVLALIGEQGRFRKLLTRDNTELVEQYNIFLLYAPNGEPINAENAQEAVLAHTSSKIQAYKSFFTLANAIRYPTANGGLVNPPLWAHRWKLRTVPKKNDQGSFFVYAISLVDAHPTVTQPVNSLVRRNDPLYARGKAFYEMLHAGTVTADYERANDALDDNVPF